MHDNENDVFQNLVRVREFGNKGQIVSMLGIDLQQKGTHHGE